MRVVILTRFYPPHHTDGIARTRWLYAREFVKLGHEVHVVTSGTEGFETVDDGVYIHQVAEDESRPDIPNVVVTDPSLNRCLKYSQAVYERLVRLHRQYPIDLIDSPLWELEGYVTRLRLPDVPMVVRLETTSMQLDEIHGNRTLSDGPQWLLHRFEASFLELADALVFDSWSILSEVRRLYQVDVSKKLHAVIHHGIETDQLALPAPAASSGRRQVLAVGRLERRKGTDLLIGSIIPRVLAASADIDFHLVGRDNSAGDQFHADTGLTYRDFLGQRAPGVLGRRVFLHGRLPDEEVEQRFREAHLVLCLSRYESFGLQYLEAMRSARPVLAFDAGAAPEIFTAGHDGVLIAPNDVDATVAHILHLASHSEEATRIGQAGFRRLISTFGSRRMAERCATFFEQVLALRHRRPRVIQMMDCLIDRDGVSSIAIDYQHLLTSMGYDAVLAGRFCEPEVRHHQTPLETLAIRSDDVVLYHYWNYNESACQDAAIPARKVMIFHNITDPAYFDPSDPAYRWTSKGYRQLRELGSFDRFAAFSEFSADVLRMTFGPACQTRVLSPVLDAETLRAAPYDAQLLATLRARPERKLLFVGRVVPHKRQEDLVRLVDEYRRQFADPLHLYLLGAQDPRYVATLNQLSDRLGLHDRVTLTGSVTQEQLNAYFRAADVYVSMSEHEGFGLPLVNAMVFDLPVFAFAKGAVGETVGDNGCLFKHKRFAELAERIHRVLHDETVRGRVLERQRRRLQDFSAAQVKEQLRSLVEELETA